MQRGKIGTYEQARKFLASHHGVHFREQSSIFRLFKRHQVKAKTGRYRHQKADPKEQEAFKNFADKLRGLDSEGKPVRVLYFDDARFGVISWHRGR